MKLSAWGKFPVIESELVKLSDKDLWNLPFIINGNLRSYGDAALGERHLPFHKNRLLHFDDQNGLLTCESGVLLSDIIDVFLIKGWFLKVTPGTKLITIGGAIASDVHGKNHHIQGCFSECVESLVLLLPNNQLLHCSRTNNSDFFYATCGGMGLTGIIVQASIFLKKVSSKSIIQKTLKTSNLEETFDAFEKFKQTEYSVAWIDCLSKGDSIGRSLLMIGDFMNDNDFSYKKKSKINIPIEFPSFTLNKYSVKIFNELYYNKSLKNETNQIVSIDSFFYPLDSINNWNRIYGKNGFIQFQFILPKSSSFDGLKKLLESISASGMGSFLAVLKLYGASNNNLLSFPLEGYSLALDFKMQKGLVKFIEKLTDQVVDFGGRVYLSKDALLLKRQFDLSYKNADKFRNFRKKMELDKHFQSLLSRRLEI
jgi:decaprenylphospho-beta-D-ribofuranose 2-oxidase